MTQLKINSKNMKYSIMIAIVLVLLYVVFDLRCKVPEYFSALSPMPINDESAKAPAVKSPAMKAPAAKAPVAAPAVATSKAEKSSVTGHAGSKQYASIGEKTEMNLPSCMNNAAFVSSNLLPKEDSKMESFAEFSPLNMKDTNFIDSSKFVIGTQSQSLRNANYQLRSDPPNPQKEICPWMQSTIVPEHDRRALEIGTKTTAAV